MLKAVENDTSGKGYCGPTVVASITGMPLSKVLDAFRDVRYGVGWQRRFRRKPRIAGTPVFGGAAGAANPGVGNHSHRLAPRGRSADACALAPGAPSRRAARDLHPLRKE